MILVDTSVWVDHLRLGDERLEDLLRVGEVVCHPFVIGELACGNLSDREEVLSLLAALPSAPRANDGELLAFIDRHHLMGLGLGLVDMHLLASAILAGVGLWTLDRRLAAAALQLGHTPA